MHKAKLRAVHRDILRGAAGLAHCTAVVHPARPFHVRYPTKGPVGDAPIAGADVSSVWARSRLLDYHVLAMSWFHTGARDPAEGAPWRE